MIPFDLDQFDEAHERGKTAEAVEGIAKRFLGRAGVERGGAALVLSRLYTRCVFRAFSTETLVDITRRADTKSRLNGFITWGEEIIMESTNLFLVSSSVISCLKPANKFLFSAGSGDLTSGLRSNKDGAFRYSAKSFVGSTEDSKICRQFQGLHHQRRCP